MGIYAVPTVFALFHRFTHEPSGFLRTEFYARIEWTFLVILRFRKKKCVVFIHETGHVPGVTLLGVCTTCINQFAEVWPRL